MKRTILMLFILLLSACAPKTQEVKKQRYFWPPPPNDPKIEFIGVYSSNRDLPKQESFLRKLTGDTDIEIRLRKPLGIVPMEQDWLLLQIWYLGVGIYGILTKMKFDR